MVKIVWADTALEELNAICEYIQTVNEKSAKKLFQKVFDAVSNLEAHPEMGSFPQELKSKRYRHLVCSPCRVFYRYESNTVFIVHVFRDEKNITDNLWQE